MQIAINATDTPSITTTKSTTTAATTDECVWGQGSQNAKCNQNAGEVFMRESSVMVSSLDQCKKSCEDAKGCQSVTYFKTGWCAHFSTPCTKTKKSQAVVERLTTPCKPVLTSEFHYEFTWWLCGPHILHARDHKSMHPAGMHTRFACTANHALNSFDYAHRHGKVQLRKRFPVV